MTVFVNTVAVRCVHATVSSMTLAVSSVTVVSSVMYEILEVNGQVILIIILLTVHRQIDCF